MLVADVVELPQHKTSNFAIVHNRRVMRGYHHNHYVPISYQRRFMRAGQGKYYRLDLKPQTVFNGSVKYTRKAQHHWGPDGIFAEDDLYTTKWGAGDNTDIERFFFGQRDDEGVPAI